MVICCVMNRSNSYFNMAVLTTEQSAAVIYIVLLSLLQIDFAKIISLDIDTQMCTFIKGPLVVN